jgi:hypothetical protein
MKRTMKILIIVLFGFSLALKAQNTTKKTKAHRIWITTIDDSKIKGILFSVDSELIKVVRNSYKKDSDLIPFKAEQILKLKIRRKGKVWKGAGIGALSGFVAGGLWGIVEGDDDPNQIYLIYGPYTKEEKALGRGMSLAIIGSGVGSVIATKRSKFIINGDLEKYKYHLPELKSYSLE